MLIVKVKKGEKIDKFIKQYKQKFDKTGILKATRKRAQFTKKSVLRRHEILKAIYLEKKRNEAL